MTYDEYDRQRQLFDRYETVPQRDPKDALHEAILRHRPRGMEIVTDPQGRVA